MKKKLLPLLAALLLLFTALPVYAASDGLASGPSVTGKAAVLMDAATGTILCGKNVDEQMYPASLTKIMTAILVIENLELDSQLLIDDEVADTYTNWADVRVSPGDRITVEQALYALLLDSNNAIAVAFAKTVAGSVEAFASMMNEKAAAIGCTDTHFVTPNGLHNDTHLSTAHDLAVMTRYALGFPLFVQIAGTDTYEFPKTILTPSHTCKNTNWLLNGTGHKLYVKNELRAVAYDGFVCGKTGTTDQAGGCLMGVAKRDDTELIVVMLGSGKKSDGYVDRYVDCITYLDWGFDSFHTVRAMNAGALLGTIPVKRGSVLSVDVVVPEDRFITMRKNRDVNDIEYTFEAFSSLQAPVRAGDTAGTYKLYSDGSLLGEYSCITAKDVPEGGFLSRFGIPDATAYKIYRTIAFVLAGLAAVCAAFTVISFIRNGGRPRRTFSRRSRY